MIRTSPRMVAAYGDVLPCSTVITMDKMGVASCQERGCGSMGVRFVDSLLKQRELNSMDPHPDPCVCLFGFCLHRQSTFPVVYISVYRDPGPRVNSLVTVFFLSTPAVIVGSLAILQDSSLFPPDFTLTTAPPPTAHLLRCVRKDLWVLLAKILSLTAAYSYPNLAQGRVGFTLHQTCLSAPEILVSTTNVW